MGRKKKLIRFAELQTMSNVIENPNPTRPELYLRPGEPVDLKGKWSAMHFENANPVVLELACGRGEYTLELAAAKPDTNVIGVDVKGARIWKGATTARDAKMENVAFLRSRIECIEAFFAPGEVTGIWITFPDPFPKSTDANRRLTSPHFLERYTTILQPGGLLHLKTDDQDLFAYSLEMFTGQDNLEVLFHSADIYASPLPYGELAYKTHYERKHLLAGKAITYIRARRTQD